MNETKQRIEKLRDVDADGRSEAIRAVAALGAPAVLPLVEALTDREWHVRQRVVETLGEMGDERAVLPLIGALKDREWYVRRAAIQALDGIGADRPAVLPLIEALKDGEARVRQRAAQALGEIAVRQPFPELRAALPLLRRLSRARPPEGAIFRDALQRIEEATEALKHLPLPAEPPASAVECLPIPAHPEAR
jgi:hypothetical protein